MWLEVWNSICACILYVPILCDAIWQNQISLRSYCFNFQLFSLFLSLSHIIVLWAASFFVCCVLINCCLYSLYIQKRNKNVNLFFLLKLIPELLHQLGPHLLCLVLMHVICVWEWMWIYEWALFCCHTYYYDYLLVGFFHTQLDSTCFLEFSFYPKHSWHCFCMERIR